MSRKRFFDLKRWLHITNPATYEHIIKGDALYNKCRQIRWLINNICTLCKAHRSLGKYLTIDEMMVRYKGLYCPIRQYILKRLEKWGVKLWILANSVSKYVYMFDVYCGKNLGVEENRLRPRDEANAAHEVVMEMLQGLEGKGHCLVMDNFFCLVHLFKDLVHGAYMQCIFSST